jgi:predicted NAD/FAD-dependent oxidoreductase
VTGRLLAEGGWTVTVLDKGYHAGGRLATKHFRNGSEQPPVFDYGAQYFTARDRRFRDMVEDWEQRGVVTRWVSGYPTMNDAFLDTGEIRFRGSGSMRAIAQHLAEGLDIRTRTRIARIQRSGDMWVLHSDAGCTFSATHLVLTPPVPQSLALLDASGVGLPAQLRERLEAVSYTPAIALLAQLDGPSGLRLPGGLWGDGNPITWICDNSLKGVSAVPGSMTILTSPEFSETHWDAPDEEITGTVLAAATRWLRSTPHHTSMHRWRYSLVARSFGSEFAALPVPGPLYFVGDAFGGGRVEGAALSGLAAARDMLGLT